jgi:hypothetical protein
VIPEKVLNRLLYEKGEIAAEIQASIPGCRRWVAIYPAQDTHSLDPFQKTMPKHAYSVLDFELKQELIDEYFGEEDKLNQKRYYLNRLNELDRLVSTLKIDLTRFTFPWNCNYPL